LNEGFERRFGGLRRLYGAQGAQRIFDAHVVVVGVGGVGSWAAEALGRSGVGRISLVDLDHVSESNTNRQIHALTPQFGQAKVEAMRERLLLINPAVQVRCVDDFVTPANWGAVVDSLGPPCAVVDACDQMSAKVAMAAWAVQTEALFVTAGAAGGKRLGHAVEMADLSETTHDPLLAQLRYRLRKHHGGARSGRLGVQCVFSREPVAGPDLVCENDNASASDGSLNCHGYGSSVAVTATFGLCAAGWVLNQLADHKQKTRKSPSPFESAEKRTII
jgi:tRNA threonylcarbamoyladenosine dehydratase